MVKMESTREIWEQAWQSHEAPPDGYHDEILNALKSQLGNFKGQRILEIGAGSAKDSLALAERGAVSISLDFAETALNLALAGMRHRGFEIDLIQGDCFRLPFHDSSFDAVFSQGLMEHFTDPLPGLEEQVRVLTDEGILLVDVPQRMNIYTLRKNALIRAGKWFAGWETSFSLKELEHLLRRCGLEIISSYGQGYYPPLFLAIRNLHTLDLRHNTGFRIPSRIRQSMEYTWTTLEQKRWYYRWMLNIGVVARKQTS